MIKAFLNLNVRVKLIVSFFVGILLTATLGAFSLVQLNVLNKISNEIELDALPSVRYSLAMSKNVSDFRISEFQHILAADREERIRYENDMKNVVASLEKNRMAYTSLSSSPEERELYEKFLVDWNSYLVQHQKLLGLSRASRTTEALELLRGMSQKLYEQTGDDLQRVVSREVEYARGTGQRSNNLYVRARYKVIGLLAISIFLNLAITLFVSNTIVHPLRSAILAANRVASGDLTTVIKATTLDETGQLMAALCTMSASLRNIVGAVRHGTETIASASTQIAAGNSDLSSRTMQQASALERSAANMIQLTQTVKQNSENARRAQVMAGSASDLADSGNGAVREMVETIRKINEGSAKIGDIISIIEGIAFQTNILALNAAVEAARAGPDGRGFAVVAGEVRSLAQRSASAAKQISELIESSVALIQTGARQASVAGESIAAVETAIREVSDLVSEIASASEEQQVGVEQISHAVEKIDEATQRNATLVEQAATAAHSLEVQAATLMSTVRVFTSD